MWNPESTDMESGIHSVESRIQDSLGLPYMGRQKAHRALDQQGFRVNCGGGTEWFTVTGGLDDIDEFADIVKAAIVQFMQGEESSEEDRDLAESSINLAPNQAAAKMATNYGHNNTKSRQDLKGNMLHVKYNCK